MGSAVHWGVFSALMDIISALGVVQCMTRIHQCIGGYHDLCGEISSVYG